MKNSTQLLKEIKERFTKLNKDRDDKYHYNSYKTGALAYYSLGYFDKKKQIENQSKKNSALESVTNVVFGLIISFVIQLLIYPFLNIKVSINQNIFITFVFFIASFIRAYLIRRIFNKIN